MTEQISLYFREGGSDKVYNVQLMEKPEGYIVDITYGRRGSTLTAASKTPKPIPIEAARKVYDKVIKGKIAKGYKVMDAIAPPQYTNATRSATGIQCQLLNDISEEDFDEILFDDQYVAQEKHDGERKPLAKLGNSLTAANKQGLATSYPQVFDVLLKHEEDFIIDGEYIGENYFAFDLLSRNGVDMRKHTYVYRLESLRSLVQSFNCSQITVVETAYTVRERMVLYMRLFSHNKEGIVFKLKDAPYTEGRPASKGSQLKYKFYATASFIVTHANTNKRSVGLSLMDESGNTVPAGNVTIPPNAYIPDKGSIVEVRYLYAFRESGSVYQPVYLKTRTDVSPEECLKGQLKYKPQ